MRSVYGQGMVISSSFGIPLNRIVPSTRESPTRIDEAHDVSEEGAVDRIQHGQLAERLHDEQQHEPDDDETEHQ